MPLWPVPASGDMALFPVSHPKGAVQVNGGQWERRGTLGGCQRSPEPVYLKWKGLEAQPDGDFFVRSGPGTIKLPPASAKEYIRTRFGPPKATSGS